MIRASIVDLPAISACLGKDAARAMFPLSNLSRYGLGGPEPRSSRVWTERRNDQITDVMAVTMEGMAMPFLPSGNFANAAKICAGIPLIGIVGPAVQARGLEAALNIQTAPRTLANDEPHMTLSLADMKMPSGRGNIVPLSQAPEVVIRAWMADYERVALHTPESEFARRVEGSYGHYIANDSHVALMDGETPLAMTGFNARLPDAVQVGGVYTPPYLRGNGHARRALALHLAQAATAGVKLATLFTASEMAERSYASIGFRQIGFWTLLLFQEKVVGHV